jgi:hypothetical protein
MSRRTIRGAAIAILLTGGSGLAMAQSGTPQSGTPQSATPNADQHNSTTGAASTDLPTPSVVSHIPSANDSAKFNATADADDKKPTMAHALALTGVQRQMISASVPKGESGASAGFEPEITALMPDTARAQAKIQDLPADVTAKWPWMKPYQYAVVDNKILLLDPVNSFMVVDMLDR